MEQDGEDSWKLSNIGGIGSAEDMKLRADAASTEDSFQGAGDSAGVEVWRIEKFEVERIGALRAGNLSLYSGDAYIVLHTEEDEDGAKKYNLHYWIGDEATQDETGAVAYYTVTLDDLLNQKPVQYRETQDEESALFHSYFKSVVYLKGGISSGFKSVEPESYSPRLLRMSGKGKSVRVKQVEMERDTVNDSDVFLLDLGLKVYQFNAPNSSVFERRHAMEIVQEDFKAERDELELVIIDSTEELLECNDFWAAIGGEAPSELTTLEETRSLSPVADGAEASQLKSLYKISDANGSLQLTKVKGDVDELSEEDVTANDVWAISMNGKCYFYVGSDASNEERIAVRMHTAVLLEAMKLPRFAQTRIISPENCDMWNSFFTA